MIGAQQSSNRGGIEMQNVANNPEHALTLLSAQHRAQ